MRGLEMVRRRPIGPEQRLKWLLGATDGDVPRYGQVAAMRCMRSNGGRTGELIETTTPIVGQHLDHAQRLQKKLTKTA